MFKEIAKKIFSTVFLFIFFAKMAISVAPGLIGHMDEKSIYSVIMQLEIEHQSSKDSETKETNSKKEWLAHYNEYYFDHPVTSLIISKLFSFSDIHSQSFHPPVSTPPPNA